MKSTDSFMTGGAFIGNPKNYAKLATIQAGYVALLTGTYGIPIYALFPQNEPDVSQSYPSCTWTPQQIHDYVPYLAAALSAVGYPKTKIMIAEAGIWVNTYAAVAMNDPTVAAKVGILASHGYGSAPSPLTYNNVTTQPLCQTEASDFTPYDGSIKSALSNATQIHQWLTMARVSAWLYWELTGQGGDKDNEALTDNKGNVAKRANAIGNWSKFVCSGWSEASVTNPTSLMVTAFKDHSEKIDAIVAVNNFSEPIMANFAVGSVMGINVTPWLTSNSANLAAQTTLPVSSGSFSATVPARSIVTFSNTNKTPTNLKDLAPSVQ